MSFSFFSRTKVQFVFLVFCLGLAGIGIVGCDGSGSNSEPSYEFEGLWQHKGGGDFGGGGYEHYLDVSGSELSKYHVSLDVDGNRIGCDAETEAISEYDEETNVLTLEGDIHNDGSEITLEVESETLTYQPAEDDDVDTYTKIDELPDGAAARC